MSSPFPVTSATSTDRLTGLAERIALVNVPPECVVTPKGTEPSAVGEPAIHTVSARPSPSTSRVGRESAPAGTPLPPAGQPLPPAVPGVGELPVLEAAAPLDRLEALLPAAAWEPEAQPASSRSASSSGPVAARERITRPYRLVACCNRLLHRTRCHLQRPCDRGVRMVLGGAGCAYGRRRSADR